MSPKPPPAPADDVESAETENDKKKQRVIHARVSESVDDELRRRANGLGMSVSNLVRNILHHAFGLVEDLVVDSAKIARSVEGEHAEGVQQQSSASAAGAATPRAAAGPKASSAHTPGSSGVALSAVQGEAQIIGWHEVTLERNAVCARTNAVLVRGSRAAIGVLDRAGTPPVISLEALAALRGEQHEGGAR